MKNWTKYLAVFAIFLILSFAACKATDDDTQVQGTSQTDENETGNGVQQGGDNAGQGNSEQGEKEQGGVEQTDGEQKDDEKKAIITKYLFSSKTGASDIGATVIDWGNGGTATLTEAAGIGKILLVCKF